MRRLQDSTKHFDQLPRTGTHLRDRWRRHSRLILIIAAMEASAVLEL
jgi:hypothetical protein